VRRVSARAGFGRYLALWRAPYVAALLGWAMVARLSLGMTPLALLLLVRGEGSSYGAAGGVAAAYTIGVGAGAPVGGRLVDRRGRVRALVPRAIAYSVLLVSVAVLALAGAPVGAVAVAAAAAGFVLPPVGSSLRTLLPAVAPPELRSTVFALEASLQEVFFVGGALLVAVLAAIKPVAALLGAAITALVGTLALARIPPMRDTPPGGGGSRTWVGALSAPGVRTIITLAAFMGLGFGPVEVALPAFCEQHGSRSLAGLALAAFSAGSLAGGLIIGLRHGIDDRTRVLVFSAVLPVALALPLFADSIPSMCALMFAAGLPIAPLIAGAYGLVERVAPDGTHAETFAWIGTAITSGIALGTATGGWIVDQHSVRLAIASGVAASVVGALLMAGRRETMAPVSAIGGVATEHHLS
jgi:MFS family permease